MSQTNVKIPFQGVDSGPEVAQKNRPRLLGDERFKSPGPSALGPDTKATPTLLMHGARTEAHAAPDIVYGDNGTPKMLDRRHKGSHLNAGLNVGSDHLMLKAEPHRPETDQYHGVPTDLGAVLPKDQ
jgi:hypothetical protein